MRNINLITKFLEFLENERKYSLHTVRSYKCDLIEFLNYLDNANKKNNLTNIDKSFIQDFIKELVLSKFSYKSLLYSFFSNSLTYSTRYSLNF